MSVSQVVSVILTQQGGDEGHVHFVGCPKFDRLFVPLQKKQKQNKDNFYFGSSETRIIASLSKSQQTTDRDGHLGGDASFLHQLTS